MSTVQPLTPPLLDHVGAAVPRERPAERWQSGASARRSAARLTCAWWPPQSFLFAVVGTLNAIGYALKAVGKKRAG